MIVTMRQLKRLNACHSGLVEFRQSFGDRARVTRKNMLLMSKHVGFMAGSLFPERWEECRLLCVGITPSPFYHEILTNALADAMGLK